MSDYQTKSPAEELKTILQRVGKADKTAAKECVDAYGNLVWALAKKYANSIEEAETAAEEIFLDIWRYAGRFNPKQLNEPLFIFLVARRRLIRKSAE